MRPKASLLTLLNRFWKSIELLGPTDCWEWRKAVFKTGYGAMAWAGKTRTAHRISWEFFNGETGGLHVLHKCDNRLCVNPAHLFLGTNLDNIHDRMRKGRKSGFGAMSKEKHLEIARKGGLNAWKHHRARLSK